MSKPVPVRKSYFLSSKYRPSPTVENGRLTWRQPAFWRNLFIYFWFFSLLGHLLEVSWAWITNSHFTPNIPTFTPIAPPYGLGVVALILIVAPVYRRFKKMNILVVFLLATIVTAAVEYLCAVVIVLVLGDNPFWDYSAQPFNLQGYVCLQNALLFGLVSTIFLRFIFPRLENLLQKISRKALNDTFLLLVTTYTADVLFMLAKGLINR